MTIRLFLGNFDFEHRLSAPGRDVPARLKRLNAELATSWLAIARDGDWIWTPEPIEPRFFSDAVQQGLPRVFATTSLSEVPNDVECVPWGWSNEARALAERFGWTYHAPADATVKRANSRATSHELETAWGVGLEGACNVGSIDELKSAIHSSGTPKRWVVKAEFGMSARERILGVGNPTAADENWVRRRLGQQEFLFFEPWVERIGEIGIQIEIPVTGPPQLVGNSPMDVDSRGQYAGSWFEYHLNRFILEEQQLAAATEYALRAATALHEQGYFGPVGFDAMIYRDPAGTTRLRPLQDINARWTMGRLSLGWKQQLGPDQEGFWQHGARDHFLPIPGFEPRRIITTSAAEVGGTPARHASRILIGG